MSKISKAKEEVVNIGEYEKRANIASPKIVSVGNGEKQIDVVIPKPAVLEIKAGSPPSFVETSEQVLVKQIKLRIGQYRAGIGSLKDCLEDIEKLIS